MELKKVDRLTGETRSRRESRKMENRQAILQTAEEIFLEKGYQATTIDEIAERAEVTKRTLYKYFPSKLALYVHMFDDFLSTKLSVKISETVRLDLPPDQLVLKLFDVLIEYTKENEKFQRLYWMLDSDEFDGHIPEELINRVSNVTRSMFKNVIKVIKKAQKRGLVIDVDPELLVHLMSAINKGIFTHTSKERRFEIADITPDQLYAVLLKIIQGGMFRTPGDA